MAYDFDLVSKRAIKKRTIISLIPLYTDFLDSEHALLIDLLSEK